MPLNDISCRALPSNWQSKVEKSGFVYFCICAFVFLPLNDISCRGRRSNINLKWNRLGGTRGRGIHD